MAHAICEKDEKIKKNIQIHSPVIHYPAKLQRLRGDMLIRENISDLNFKNILCH